MKILVTGGSGMVGRELKKIMPDAYYPDKSQLDLENLDNVKSYMNKHKFDYVVHLAAHVGSLHDNIKNSTKYFDGNVLMNTILTKVSYETGVKNFLGILSTCIYPDSIDKFPITLDSLHEGKPHKDLMSYAYAKRSHAVQLDEYKKSFNVKYNFLVPCNMYGDVQHVGRAHFINDLVFKIHQAKKAKKSFITLFGDGSPLRQFMHGRDFANIIYMYIKNNINKSLNIAPNSNASVDEMAKVALKALGCESYAIRYDDSLPNGQHRKDVDPDDVVKNFPNFEFTKLEDGIKEIYAKLK